MSRHTTVLYALVLTALLSCPLLAQTVEVSGLVKDELGEPAVAVLVHRSGTSETTLTDLNGRYTIQALASDTLEFSMVGYERVRERVGNRRTINVRLEPSKDTRLADLVVVGYSTVERRDLTGSVSSVKLPENKPFMSVDQLLAGQAPGVFVSGSSGTLGAANLMTIRGISSIMGDNNPLYVVDGVPIYGTDRGSNSSSTSGGSIDAIGFSGPQVGGGSLSNNTEVLEGVFEKNPLASLNPEDIESIEILKDAFATAIYGSRGSAGVILITTKKGARQRPQVNLSYSLSIDRPLAKPNLLNGDEYAMIYSAYYPSATFPMGENTDWIDAVTRTAVSNTLSASVSGGSERSDYYISLSGGDYQSYIINNGLKRYAARTNLNATLSDQWRTGVNISLSKVDNKSVAAQGIYGAALTKAPNLPIYTESGDYYYGYAPNTYGTYSTYNPVAMAYINKEGIADTRLVGMVYLEYKPLDWISLRSEIGTDLYSSLSSIRKGKLPAEIETVNNQAQESTAINSKIVINNTLNMHQIIARNHFIQGVVGQSYEYANEYASSIAGDDFFSPDLMGVGSARTRRVLHSGKQEWALFSAFTRLNYQYLSRYMLGLTYRLDGSSRFNKDHRYLSTPSLSLGWRVSGEEWFKKAAPDVNDLKLRASVGWSSKDANNSYYGARSVYTLSERLYGGKNYLVMSQPGNASLNWEKTITYDLGADFSAWNDRLKVTLDYYYRKTTDMLFPSNLPWHTGYLSQQQNIADMMNAGVDLQIVSQNIRKADFSWQTVLNVSHNTNKLLRLNFQGSQLEDLNSSTKYYQEGAPAAQFFLLDWQGVDSRTGNPLWKYADGEVRDTPPVSTSDQAIANRKVFGTAMPLMHGGLTNNLVWRDWELGCLFTFSVGGKLMNSTRAQLLTYSTENANNLSKEILTAWQLPGQETDIPKLRHNSIVGQYDYAAGIGSSRFLEDASYLRLKSLEIAYNIPKELLSRTKSISRVRISASATNLFTLSGYSGIDPEVSAFGSSVVNAGYDNLTMPQSRSFRMGLSITL